MKDLGIARKFFGMEIEYGNDASISIYQNQYIQPPLESHGMGECNSVARPLDISIKLTSIRLEEAIVDPQEEVCIVRSLISATCIMRPDIANAVAQLFQFLNNPSSVHMYAAKQVL